MMCNQLINGISIDLQKSLRYFNGATIAVFLKIKFTRAASLFPNYLVLYLKDLKSSLLAVTLLKLVSSSFE